jgi:hypothetical protein
MSTKQTSEAASVHTLVHGVLEELMASRADSAIQAVDIARQGLDLAADRLFQSVIRLSPEFVEQDRTESNGFLSRNLERWGPGFGLLRVYRHLNIEAGQLFQEECLQYEEFQHEPLLGVLLRLHAHACRIFGEITTLLEGGYPDGAFARWRSLHEIAVTAIVLRDNGSAAAEDYRLYGLVQAVAGMNSFQETALEMGREQYAPEELEAANRLSAEILSQRGDDFRSRNGWARRYVGSSRFENLQQSAGLQKWRGDYRLASRDIHTDYREMGSLLAMAEAKTDLLVCGQSDSGIVEPAHSAAITLLQVTTAIVFTHIDADDCPIDYTTSIVLAKVLGLLSDQIGRVFLELHHPPNSVGTPK